MRHLLSSTACRIAAAIVLTLLVRPLLADDCTERPFEFRPNNDGQLIEEQGNCFTIVGTGNATHMGDVLVINEICQFGFRAVNHNTLVAANGDQLYSVRKTKWNAETERFEGIFTIVGGTGRFEGATGGGIHIQREGSFGVICY